MMTYCVSSRRNPLNTQKYSPEQVDKIRPASRQENHSSGKGEKQQIP